VSMVTRQGFSCIQPSAVRLPSAHLASTLSVKRRGVIYDSDGPLFVLRSCSISSGGLCLQYLPKLPGFPHRDHTGRSFRRLSGGVGGLPVGTLFTSRSLAVGHAAAFAASSLSAWFRVSFSGLSSLLRRLCFISRS
jgi:hypothetical protein